MTSPIRQRTDRAEASEPPSDLIGLEFDGRYRIEARIGQGGIGVVYRATDTKLSRRVAVKVLLEAAGMRHSQRRRFEREADALAAVSHPNVVAVLDYGVADGTPYLVMELLEGESLADLLAREAPLDPARGLRLMGQLLAGLRYVHERGVVHRDLKPGNIFMQSLKGAGEQVKLLDFGLAKFLGAADGEVENAVAAPTLTRSGEIFGTPGYMPAEQMLGKAVDASADVYSAGVILYEMLGGVRPYQGDMVEVVQQQLAGVVPRLVDAGTGRQAHAALDALLARALALAPATRFRDAAELSEAFEALPNNCVEEQSRAARDQMQRERHEASTRVGQSAATQGVGDAVTAVVQANANGARAQPPSSSATPGALARALGSLGALGASMLRASAFLIASVSAVMILVAALVIYVFSQPDLERGRAMLRRALPGDIDATLRDIKAGMKRSSGPSDPSQPTDAPSLGAQDEASASAAARTAPLPPARDPWARRAPPALQRARSGMLKGKSAGEKTLSYLQGYNRAHPEDPRGHLLLGGLYMNRGWLSDGVQQYKLAFQADASSRGDPHALRDLLNMADQPQDIWAQAAVLLRSTYGAEIRDDIVRATRRTSQSEARARLLQLNTHIAN